MTHQKTLEKAIQKAIDGGWDRLGNDDYDPDIMAMDALDSGTAYINHLEIIFNHDFAKALWKNPGYKPGETAPYGIGKKHEGIRPEWQYHLQQMAISEDPIQYLAENIND